MDARTFSEAAGRQLAALKRLMLERLALAAGAMLVALAAPVLNVSIAIAFAVGALLEALLALVSLEERRSLVASLATHREAYVLPEVKHYGDRLATTKNRRALAHSIGTLLRDASQSRAGVVLAERVTQHAPLLAAVRRALSDPRTVVEPTALAACVQLLCDGRASPLLNPSLPRTELDRWLRDIEAGIAPPPELRA